MSTVEPAAAGLSPGQKMSREEFLRHWEALPGLKRAELIRGVVYMPSPVSRPHARMDGLVVRWVAAYEDDTPGCEMLINATWLMVPREAPQPDVSLRLLEEWGGQSRAECHYVAGAPEFLAEICLSSADYDLHEKLRVYEEAGVQEYLAVLVNEQEVRWHRRVGERFVVVPPPADGICRSAVFPGLWLDSAALLANNKAGVRTALRQGLASMEHQEFVAQLAARRTS